MTQRYIFDGGRHLIITDNVLDMLREYGQTEPTHHEAGGILLGRHLIEEPDIVIDEATPPQASDRRSRYAFFRSESHSTLAKQRWENSGGKVAYLGLWHTHPEPTPTPSTTDLADWRKALRHDQYDGAYLFFAIVGTQDLRWWAGRRYGPLSRICPLVPV